MMRILIITFLLFWSSIIFGQVSNSEKIEKLKKEATRVENEIQIRTDSLTILRGEIKHLENQEYLSKFKQQDGDLSIFATLTMPGKLRKSNNPLSQIITIVNQNDTIKLTDYVGGYWIVNKGQFFGYLSEVFVKKTEEVKVFKEELEKQNEELRKKEEAEKIEKEKLAVENQTALELQKRKKYRQKIISKYGNETGQKLLDGYYWIGMTDDMARVSLGSPRSINKTVGAWGVNEQWVYYSIYLYFENGKLNSYQNSR